MMMVRGLELNDILQEQVLLALPLQRVCRAECRNMPDLWTEPE